MIVTRRNGSQLVRLSLGFLTRHSLSITRAAHQFPDGLLSYAALLTFACPNISLNAAALSRCLNVTE